MTISDFNLVSILSLFTRQKDVIGKKIFFTRAQKLTKL